MKILQKSFTTHEGGSGIVQYLRGCTIPEGGRVLHNTQREGGVRYCKSRQNTKVEKMGHSGSIDNVFNIPKISKV